MSLEQYISGNKKDNKVDTFSPKIESYINDIISDYPHIQDLNPNFNLEIQELKNKLRNIKNGNIEKTNLVQIKYRRKKR